ncbi:MAG: N-acetylmuramoyl-L-alanine amidase [Anaerocolumna sp.]
MDEKLLKRMAVNSVALMLTVVLISVVLSYYDRALIHADNSGLNSDSSGQNQNAVKGNRNTDFNSSAGSDTMVVQNSFIRQQLGDKYLIIKKSEKSYYNVNIEDLYIDRSIQLIITNLDDEFINGTSIIRINKASKFMGIPKDEPAGTSEITKNQQNEEAKSYNTNLSKETENEKLLIPEVISAAGEVRDYGSDVQQMNPDPVKDFKIEYKQDEYTRHFTVVINISLDSIYAPVLYQEEDYIYIDLRRPKDVYDKIVVIDAGHGGKDCGTFSQGEQYYEKDINLSLVLKLKKILDKEDFKVYYTRTTDKTLFLNPRVNFANDVEADLFISIHCNSSESDKPGGSEVLFNEKQQGNGFLSKRLAQIALEEITNITHKENRGLVPGSEMVVVGKSKVPMALIEVAFMSNQEDLNFLLKDENERMIAEAIHKTILRAFNEMGK